MKLEIFTSEIRKTGFVLENHIALELKRAGWTVISNKYYQDDFEGSVREIDLLAYKVRKVQHFDVYTTLIISCKKSEVNIWALLSRDINLKDPNSDWWPLHTWSNDKSLLYQLSQLNCSKDYHDEVTDLGVSEVLSIPDVEVFAFQEMNNKSGAPQNDKNIFNSLTSLMKAQAYELSVLPQRKEAPSVYQFNLLSVVDADLVRLRFVGEDIKAKPIQSEHYIARYIINKKECFSRVRFINANHFKDAIIDYSRLHNANCKWFDRTCNKFFDGIAKDWKRMEVYTDDFRKKIKGLLTWRVEHEFKKSINLNDQSFYWQSDKEILAVIISAESDVIEYLNNDSKSKKIVADALKKIYRYTGDFIFDDNDVPF